KLEGDKWSDPRDESGYSAHDLLSLGFTSSPEHMKFVQNSRPLSSVNVEDLDAVLEDEARKIANTNFIVASRFKPHALREGHRVSGPQRYFGAAAVWRMIGALGF